MRPHPSFTRRGRNIATRLLFALGLCATLAPAGWSAAATVPLQPCRIHGISHDVLCGQIRRPLNPNAHGDTPQIDIHFTVIPAVARRGLPDPVFFFAGGPGQAATRLGGEAQFLLKRLNNRRDLVLIDQRGTGHSAPLECPALPATAPLQSQADAGTWSAAMASCLAALQRLPYGDLRFFTTTLAMQDADAVRQALGFDRINVVGGSYGTRAVLEYLRAFPTRVRRAVIDGVAPPDSPLTQSLGQDVQAALHAWLSACESDRACAARYPTLRPDFHALVRSTPRPITVAHPVTGQAERFLLTRLQLLSLVRSPLYSPTLAVALPAAIADATHDRFGALFGLASALTIRPATRLAMGMHLSVICAEDLPPSAAPTAPAADDDLGSIFEQQYTDLCAHWPRGDVPPAFRTIPRSDVPTLVLSGGLDPVTPPRHGARVAAALGPHARHVVVPQAGHGILAQPCVPDLVHRFIDRPSDRAPDRTDDRADDDTALLGDTRCATDLPRPPLYEPLSTPQTTTAGSVP